jgi:hypothetical protein
MACVCRCSLVAFFQSAAFTAAFKAGEHTRHSTLVFVHAEAMASHLFIFDAVFSIR